VPSGAGALLGAALGATGAVRTAALGTSVVTIAVTANGLRRLWEVVGSSPDPSEAREGGGASLGPFMSSERVGALLEALRGRGERVTTARRALLTALDEAGDHRSADELAAEVARAHPEVHRATIYRTLETLRRLGVVEHTHLGHGPAVYHLADEVHQHLVCEDCGMVVEVSPKVFRPLERTLQRDFDFTVSSRHFAFSGRCGACSRALTSQPGAHGSPAG
jgi:Fur family ferric uptake transcriptional regulator